MATSFEERLSRLESKRIEAGGAPSRDLPDYSNRGGSGGTEPPKRPKKEGRKLPLILFAIAALGGLPLGAYFITAHLSENPDLVAAVKEKTAVAADSAALMNIAYGASKDDEQRDARRLMNSVSLRFNTGTMTDEEIEYWGSDEGQQKLAEQQKKAMNLEGMEKLAKKIYGVD